jgi:transcriptional/translational regulatory protein YebC/TACO1
MVPDNLVQVRGEQAKAVVDLVDAIEDLDDVQKVYTNADIPDEEL